MDITASELDFMAKSITRFDSIIKRAKKTRESICDFNSVDDKDFKRADSLYFPDLYYHFKHFEYGVSIVCDSWYQPDKKSASLVRSPSGRRFFHIETVGFVLSDLNLVDLQRSIHSNNGLYGCFERLDESFPLFYSAIEELLEFLRD